MLSLRSIFSKNKESQASRQGSGFRKTIDCTGKVFVLDFTAPRTPVVDESVDVYESLTKRKVSAF